MRRPSAKDKQTKEALEKALQSLESLRMTSHDDAELAALKDQLRDALSELYRRTIRG